MATEAAVVTHGVSEQLGGAFTNMSAAVASTPVSVLSVTPAVAQVVTLTKIRQIPWSQPSPATLTHSMVPLHISVATVEAILPPASGRGDLDRHENGRRYGKFRFVRLKHSAAVHQAQPLFLAQL